MAGHSGGAHQAQSSRIQSNVIKTMILVTAYYSICWFPNYVVVLILSLNSTDDLHYSSYYVSIFIAFLYTCTNPFIYAVKFDPIKQTLLRLMPCVKIREPATESAAEGQTGTQRGATISTRAGHN